MALTSDEHRLQGVCLCVGSHWPESFVPEDQLAEAVNEFLAMPFWWPMLKLIKSKQIKLRVNTKAEKDKCGCWLMFGIEDGK